MAAICMSIDERLCAVLICIGDGALRVPALRPHVVGVLVARSDANP